MIQKVLGVKIDLTDEKEILRIIKNAVDKNEKIQIATVNNEFLVEAQKNDKFKQVLNNSNLNICDSTGLCYALKFFYKKTTTRIPGADLFEKICSFCELNGYSVFLLGGKKGVASRAASNLNKRYKSLKIVGVSDGLRIDENTPMTELLQQINHSGPNVIFVALGAPKQELWIAQNIKFLQANCFIGIGGTLDYVSGQVKRAPAWARKAGLEWLFRLLRQPSRFARIWKATVLFPILVIREKAKGQSS